MGMRQLVEIGRFMWINVKRLLATIIGGLFSICSLSTQAQVLTGPITNIVNGHWYYLLAPTNWTAAEAQAVNLGGHLTAVNDDAENTWIYTTFANYGGQSHTLWIGLNDAAQEGLWVWNDGDSSAYRNWAPGEPNNGGVVYPDEDQALIRDASMPYPGRWNDAPENQIHCAVVEVMPPALSSPPILSGPITNPANGHLYYLLPPTNWLAAETIAGRLGGHLVTINDDAENNWVFNNFGGFGSSTLYLWLGLNDAAQEGNFVWSSGDPSSYRNWAPGEPNNGGSFYPNEDQVLMRLAAESYNGFWNDAPESQKHLALVEVKPPQVVKAHVKISVIDLCWMSVTNGSYQLQYRTNMTTSPWLNLGTTIYGTGLEMCVPIDMPAGQVQKFYRVLSFE